MFGWRRKSDGFDWRQHVRTTVKLRRDMRRERLDLAKDALADKAQGAVRGASGGVARFAALLGTLLQRGFSAVGRGIAPLSGWIAEQFHALLSHVTRPQLAVPLSIAGAAALIAATIDISTRGLTREAVLPLTVGLLLVLFVLPTLEGLFSSGDRDVRPLPFAIALFVIGSLSAGLYAATDDPNRIKAHSATGGDRAVTDGAKTGPALPANPATVAGATALNRLDSREGLGGRAQAVRGDTLRLQGMLVRLSGIESPEALQRCQRSDGKSWRCGESAQAELERLIDGKPVICKLAAVRGARDATPPLVDCVQGQRDLAVELVRAGSVFVTALASPQLAALDADAKRAKRGVWQGPADSPEGYRSKAFDQARAKAPNGCAIKGQVTGLGRQYLMPWAVDYAKARIRRERGDRWFCSEAEAKAAGFVEAPPG